MASSTTGHGPWDLETARQRVTNCRRAHRAVRRSCSEYRSVAEVLRAATRSSEERELLVDQLLSEGSSGADDVIVAMFVPHILKIVAATQDPEPDEIVGVALASLARQIERLKRQPCAYSSPWFILRSMHRDVYRSIARDRRRRDGFIPKDTSQFDLIPDTDRTEWFSAEMMELTEWVATEAKVAIEDAALVAWSRGVGLPLANGCSESQRVDRSRRRSKAERALVAALG